MPTTAREPDDPAATLAGLRFAARVVIWMPVAAFAGLSLLWTLTRRTPESDELLWVIAGYVKAMAEVAFAFVAARALDLIIRP